MPSQTKSWSLENCDEIGDFYIFLVCDCAKQKLCSYLMSLQLSPFFVLYMSSRVADHYCWVFKTKQEHPILGKLSQISEIANLLTRLSMHYCSFVARMLLSRVYQASSVDAFLTLICIFECCRPVFVALKSNYTSYVARMFLTFICLASSVFISRMLFQTLIYYFYGCTSLC